MKVQVIDYGMGNLGSVKTAVGLLGFNADIISRPSSIENADKIILPGVGSFNDAMSELRDRSWIESIKEHAIGKQKPILGICLGMQLLASHGEEGGGTQGLNLISGVVKHLNDLGCRERVPHVGWNDTHVKNNSALFLNIPSGNDFFYVHSYGFSPTNSKHVTSVVHYGQEIAASVESDNVFGTQFHPEKSSKAGLQLLKNFLDF